ncbi:hypothetical protein [Dactylosporangium salmoneum]|uniref:Uncharacterized protein n=1 Tax=Dactylosporangium salmoneum TaxID=53361 RepID=A0ABP5SCA0_9ACTN
MGTFVLNVAKGRIAHYASLPNANDALIAIPIEASGVEADATLIDYDTVAALLAGPSNEQTTMGRKVLTNVGVTIDDANDRVALDSDNIVWAAATGNPISDILIAYDPDTTTGTDADLIPLSWHDFAATPDGTDITVTVNDFARAS